MYVSVIQFSLFSANFIVIFQAVAKILQIYHESVLMGHHVCVCVCVCVWILFSSYLNVIHKGDDRLAAIHSTYSHLPAEPSWMPP